MTTKVCPRCKETKEVREFGKNVTRPDGLQFYCKTCSRAALAASEQKRKASVAAMLTTPVRPLTATPKPEPAIRPKPQADPVKDRLAHQRKEIARVTELALHIHEWACNEKDAHEKDTNEPHAYFTVPEVQEKFNISERLWTEVKEQMMRLGLALGFEAFKGHYIGAPGSQATVLAAQVDRAVSAIERLCSSLEANQASREWETIRPKLEEISSIRIDKLPRLLQGAGIKVSANMERLLLTPPSTD